MYIFEIIAKYIKGKNFKFKNNYNPKNEEFIDSNPDDCIHVFMPLDSSNEYFSCKYCGLILPKDKLKDINIFRN